MPTSLRSTDATIAQAIALSSTGHSTRQIEQRIGVDHSTVAEWLKNDDVRQELSELTAHYIQIEGDALTAKWTRVNHEVVDDILDGKREVTVQQAMVAFGISRDKSVAANQKSTGPSITINFNVPTTDIVDVTDE